MTTGKAEIAARSTLDSRSRMVVPIAFGDRVLGAISFESSSRTFVGVDLVLAWDLARRAGRAIENARSFERTKRSLRMRDEFLGIVSHDVKGLLGSIKLNATLIERLGDARTRKMAGSIGRITDRMGRLVNDLLDVASIEAGKLRIVPTDCSAAGLVREVVETFAPIAAEKSVRLVSRGSQAVRVSCDRGRILQALANLVSNAIKFTPAGGTVAVAARKRRGEVVFSVADTGPGIASEQRNRLFRHFSPGDPSDRRGVGLGLYIARALVEEHGGRIGVRTSPGDGSEFFFSLPR